MNWFQTPPENRCSTGSGNGGTSPGGSSSPASFGKENAKGHGNACTSEEATAFQEEPYVGFAAPFSSEAVFANGLLHGNWLVSDAHGRPITSIHYREGLRDGNATWWNPQGGKVQQIEYKAGLLDGELVKWDAAENCSAGDSEIPANYSSTARPIPMANAAPRSPC